MDNPKRTLIENVAVCLWGDPSKHVIDPPTGVRLFIASFDPNISIPSAEKTFVLEKPPTIKIPNGSGIGAYTERAIFNRLIPMLNEHFIRSKRRVTKLIFGRIGMISFEIPNEPGIYYADTCISKYSSQIESTFLVNDLYVQNADDVIPVFHPLYFNTSRIDKSAFDVHENEEYPDQFFKLLFNDKVVYYKKFKHWCVRKTLSSRSDSKNISILFNETNKLDTFSNHFVSLLSQVQNIKSRIPDCNIYVFYKNSNVCCSDLEFLIKYVHCVVLIGEYSIPDLSPKNSPNLEENILEYWCMYQLSQALGSFGWVCKMPVGHKFIPKCQVDKLFIEQIVCAGPNFGDDVDPESQLDVVETSLPYAILSIPRRFDGVFKEFVLHICSIETYRDPYRLGDKFVQALSPVNDYVIFDPLGVVFNTRIIQEYVCY